MVLATRRCFSEENPCAATSRKINEHGPLKAIGLRGFALPRFCLIVASMKLRTRFKEV
jgi:hypothetical protein